MQHPIFHTFCKVGNIPVLEIDSVGRAIPLAESLQAGPSVGGSWMAKRQMIAEGKFDEITRRTKEASDLVR